MKLTEKQKAVYNGLLKIAVNNDITAENRIIVRDNLKMNSVSYGLVIKALSDKNIISINKNDSINIISDTAPEGKIEKESIEAENDPISVDSDTDIYSFKADDFDQNLFFELKSSGARFVPSDYMFTSKNPDVISRMKSIVEFYTSPSDPLTKSQRKLRDQIIEKHNIDMICKKVGSQLHFMNTWGLASVKDVVKDISKAGRKNITVIGNRIVVEVDSSDN